MSYNPNKSIDADVCKGIEKLYDALRRKGITLRGIELSKELMLFGKPTKDIPLDVGLGFNHKHIRVTTAAKKSPEDTTEPLENATPTPSSQAREK